MTFKEFIIFGNKISIYSVVIVVKTSKKQLLSSDVQSPELEKKQKPADKLRRIVN
jgi:hypothetical protein